MERDREATPSPRKKAKQYASVEEIPKRFGFAVVVPDGLFPETGTVWHHYRRHCAERRVSKVRERVADARIEEVKREESGQ